MIVMYYGWMNALWMDGWLMNWYANMVSCEYALRQFLKENHQNHVQLQKSSWSLEDALLMLRRCFDDASAMLR